MSPKKTRRKFYNKWLYKITLNVPGVSVTRIYNFKDISEGIFNDDQSSWKIKAHQNRTCISDLFSYLDTLTDYFKRIERDNIDIYTNDKSVYDELYNRFKNQTFHRFEPDEQVIQYLDRKNIIVKKLPKNRYQYRVYLKPHNVKDKSDKSRFLDWLRGQTPKISISDAVEQWFINTDWNWDRRYILVEDEPTLLMLKLRGSNIVGSVYNYVIPINT